MAMSRLEHGPMIHSSSTEDQSYPRRYLEGRHSEERRNPPGALQRILILLAYGKNVFDRFPALIPCRHCSKLWIGIQPWSLVGIHSQALAAVRPNPDYDPKLTHNPAPETNPNPHRSSMGLWTIQSPIHANTRIS